MIMEQALQAVLDKRVDGKKIFGTSFAVKKDDFIWHGACGDLTPHSAYFIASTTKLFTTALILQLKAAGKLALHDPISRYLHASVLSGLHQYRGKTYTHALTITHLLAHTSGLADYFQSKSAQGRSLQDELIAGEDQSWTFAQAIARAKTLPAHFPPGATGKAHYADTNFQLLGKIIENITQQTYADTCAAQIIRPLGLRHTYLYQNPDDTTPHPLYYRDKPLPIPQAMTSFTADGGMVSTSADMLSFIEAFFTGQLFPMADIAALQVWNNIFFPLRAGIGIQLVKMPWLLNPRGAIPELIGHAGLSGALAFYSPRDNIFIAGTVNQAARPDLAFKTMMQLTQALIKS